VSASSPSVRVFISAKSDDYEQAQLLFRHLAEAGFQTFFSRESLPQVGSADYRREIDRALDEADHLIVVTSRRENALSPWVEAEWGFFINEKRSGRKRGNLITMAVGGLKPADLPPSLRYYEVIPFDPAAFHVLHGYLGETIDTGAGKEVAVPRGPAGRAFRLRATLGGPPAVALVRAPDSGSFIVTAGLDGALRVYDVGTCTRRAVLGSARYWKTRHEGMVTALEVSADGRYVAVGHLDGALHVWDVEQEQEIAEARRHDVGVSSVVFMPDSRTLASASRDGALRFHAIGAPDDGQMVARAATKPAPIVHLATLPRSQWLVVAMVNAATGQHVLQIQEGSSPQGVLATVNLSAPFKHLVIARDESIMATAGNDGRVRVYDLEAVLAGLRRGRNPKVAPLASDFQAHNKPVSSLALLADGKTLITSAPHAPLTIWNLDTQHTLGRLQNEMGEGFISTTTSADGGLLVAALEDGRVRIWDVG
jgi:WD40 repeat protein